MNEPTPESDANRNATDGDVDLYFTAARRRTRQVGIAIIIAAIVIPLALILLSQRDRIERWLRGEADLMGNPTFTFQRGEEEVSGYMKIHADLLPDWLVHEANRADWGVDSADERYRELLEAIEEDPNLKEITSEMREILRADRQVEEAERLIELADRWSAYMAEKGEPYLVQGNVVSTGRTNFFYVRAYFVESDVEASVGETSHRARIVRRVDSTNVRESYLGSTSKGTEGAIVILDRLYVFTIDDIWPLVDDEGPLDPMVAAWAPAVRAEMERAIPAPDLEALRDGLEDRRALEETIEAIEARRECGGGLRFANPGYRGIAPDTLARLEKMVSDDPLELCPTITEDEFDAIREASQGLRESEGLDRGLGALIGWLARGVTMHEARHVADDVEHNGLEEPLPCTGCYDGMSVATRAELSAYVSSLAWGPSPSTTLFQACRATERRGGPHRRAIFAILDEMGGSCADDPPDDIRESARRIEAEWFGRSDRLELPQNFPRLFRAKDLRR